jgi:ribosomal 50S subunit-recycling heat shock protein
MAQGFASAEQPKQTVKVGDKVKLRAEKAGSGYVVTAIETAK